jgi:hypothetical protein
MGERKGENEIWRLEKEAKGRWQEEKEKEYLGFVMCKQAIHSKVRVYGI